MTATPASSPVPLQHFGQPPAGGGSGAFGPTGPAPQPRLGPSRRVSTAQPGGGAGRAARHRSPRRRLSARALTTAPPRWLGHVPPALVVAYQTDVVALSGHPGGGGADASPASQPLR